jgi:hypothetical protein
VLAAVGVAGSGVGLAALLVAGERLGARDPAGLFVGAGGIAMGGAAVGAFAALTMADGPGNPDRVRTATIALDYTFGRPSVLDEAHPGTGMLRLAPTFWTRDGGARMRPFLAFGGMLGTERDVDPRPQLQGQGGFAGGLVERRLSGALGLDLAMSLPYPVLRGRPGARLGRAELRWKPEVQFRRHAFSPGEDDARTLERTMLLPLTVGMRWVLSPRQRFTFYIGPRFDFLGTAAGGGELVRGRAVAGPVYGEAWYDIDVPFTWLARREHARADVNGQLTLGYVHSRFDGRGFNVSGAIGFAGPLQVAWHLRVRPRGARVAWQGSVGAWIGNGVTPFFSIGTVLPDVGRPAR